MGNGVFVKLERGKIWLLIWDIGQRYPNELLY